MPPEGGGQKLKNAQNDMGSPKMYGFFVGHFDLGRGGGGGSKHFSPQNVVGSPKMPVTMVWVIFTLRGTQSF